MSLREPELLTLPGPVDLHVHLREPSTNHSETIESGTLAALLGGFVLVCDMTNNPGMPTWTYRRLLGKEQRAYRRAYIPTAFYSGSQPESNNENELEKMARRSIGLKSYLGETTGNDSEYAADDFMEIWRLWHELAPDKPIMVHRGSAYMPDIVDFIARQLGHHVHFCHVNSPEEVAVVARAKADDLSVSCGVCPHHLFKTSHDVLTEGKFAEMQPPLVHQTDAEELFYYLVKGRIDTIESDHAPHDKAKKWQAEVNNGSCYGVPGIEFVLPLLLYQMKKGRISLERLIEATSTKPADIIGVRVSNNTNVAWSMEEYRIEDEESQVTSGASWTPYLGMLAVGKPQEVSILGKTLMKNGKVVDRYPRVVINRDEII